MRIRAKLPRPRSLQTISIYSLGLRTRAALGHNQVTSKCRAPLKFRSQSCQIVSAYGPAHLDSNRWINCESFSNPLQRKPSLLSNTSGPRASRLTHLLMRMLLKIWTLNATMQKLRAAVRNPSLHLVCFSASGVTRSFGTMGQGARRRSLRLIASAGPISQLVEFSRIVVYRKVMQMITIASVNL